MAIAVKTPDKIPLPYAFQLMESRKHF